MQLNETYELNLMCPSDEAKLFSMNGLPLPGILQEYNFLELEHKLNKSRAAHRKAAQECHTAKSANWHLRKANETLKTSIAELSQTREKLLAENARLLMALQNEREAHEQSRLLAEKRLKAVSIQPRRETASEASQGRKGRTMRDRMLQVRF